MNEKDCYLVMEIYIYIVAMEICFLKYVDMESV